LEGNEVEILVQRLASPAVFHGFHQYLHSSSYFKSCKAA
jgi:hypothetical protein